MVNIDRNFLITLNNPQQMLLKLLQRELFRTAEASGEITGNKIADKITNI